MDLEYARLREWNIKDQAKQSGMQKLAEDFWALINQEWKAGKTEDDNAWDHLLRRRHRRGKLLGLVV